MTPKEKAEELFERFYGCDPLMDYTNTKQCALIAVNEILSDTGCGCCNLSEKNYWNQVRQEIQKL